MDNNMLVRVENELRKFYAHIGENDVEFVNEKVHEEAWSMVSMMNAIDPELISVGPIQVEGYCLDLLITQADAQHVERKGKLCVKETIKSLQLVLVNDDFHYVIYTYDTYKSEDWQPGNDFEFENEAYQFIVLNDINVDDFI